MGHLTHTVGGDSNLVSFRTPARVPVESLKCHFTPIQNGSGDPSPSNVRPITGWTGIEAYKRGKNLLPTTLPSNAIYGKMSNGVIESASTQWIFALPCAKSTNYTLSNATRVGWCVGFANALPALGNAVTYKGAMTNRDAFPVNSGDNVYMLIMTPSNVSISEMATIYKCMIELGSTATSYEPYQGETIPMTFPVLGKNKLDIGTATFIQFKKYVLDNPLPPGIYTLSALITSEDTDKTYNLVLFQNAGESGNVTAYLPRNTRASVKITTVKPCSTIYIYASTGYTESADDECTWSDVQLELGSEATAYEPYDPNNTVYGGYVDLAAGEVVAEWIKYHISSPCEMLMANRAASSGGVYFYKEKFPECKLGAGDIALARQQEFYSHGKIENPYTEKDNCAWVLNSGTFPATIRLAFSDEMEIDTVEKLDTWLDEVGGVDVAYPLKYPIHYPLTPAEISTLLDRNNFYSNTNGNTEVSYAVHDTAPIRAAKKRIAANEPHIITPASAGLVSFSTDMAAPLKECKVGFLPVQNGSGDPSPTNVRPISGWTGCDVYGAGKNLITADLQFYSGRPDASVYQASATNQTIAIPIPQNATVHWHKSGTGSSPINYYGYVCLADELPYVDMPVYESTAVRNVKDLTFQTGNHKYLLWSVDTQYFSTVMDLNSMEGCVNVGSTIDYAPIGTGTTIPISWQSAGTIYGGYVDLVRGEVVADRINRLLNDKSLWYEDSVRISYRYDFNDRKIYDNSFTGLLCSFALVDETKSVYVRWRGSTQYRFSVLGIPITTLQSMSDEGTAEISYQLATPITYALTPQIIKTLRGVNNIWSNTNGTIDLSYWSH